ncbi:MAG: hypothetical protein R3C68_06690 [Myxococcota bacterium]
MGTGGDFARSVGLSGAASKASTLSTRRIDIGRARFRVASGGEGTRLFANISSFGCSGLIVDKVNRSTKALGGRASFLLGTVKGMVAYRNQRVRLRIDDDFEEDVLINTVAVANGRYFGGAMKVAPNACLNDGRFEVVIIGDIGLSTFLRYSRKLYDGKHLSLPGIRCLSGSRIRATPLGNRPVLMDVDGEQPGELPVAYDILPAALQVQAPWSQAEAMG